jgi:hypothetical protein
MFIKEGINRKTDHSKRLKGKKSQYTYCRKGDQ